MPDWMWRADTLGGLASQLGIDPGELRGTVERFNGHAVAGHDPDFHRGETSFERASGDPSRPDALANLGPIVTPPFYTALRTAAAIRAR